MVARLRTEWLHLRKHRELAILSLPALVWMVIFSYAPMIGLVIAFKRYRYDLGIFGSQWVGFKNFEFFFTSRVAGVVTRNTVLHNLGFFFLTTFCAVTLAILLNEVRRGSVKLYQTAMFLPYFLSWVVVSYIGLAFLGYRQGYLNQARALLALDPVRWYFEPHRPLLLHGKQGQCP